MMLRIAIGVLAMLGTAAAQATTRCYTPPGSNTTTCTSANGARTTCYTPPGSNTSNCTTQPGTDWNATGQQIGAGIGQGIATRQQEKFCKKNPGQVYHGYKCPTEEERSFLTAKRWMDDHPKFHQSDENAKAMVAYMKENKLDPREYKSYNKAFKALKKAGKVELNK
jgi:hypothetical protein